MNPHTESGQNLYRQYIGKKGKAVLDARWVHECVKAGALQTFVNNFAECKVTGNEQYVLSQSVWSTLHHTRRVCPPAPPPAATPIIPPGIIPQATGPSRQQPAPPTVPQVVQNPEAFQTPLPQTMQAVEPPGASFAYQTYQAQLQPAARSMQPAAPPQTWQAPNSIAPEQTQGHLPQQMIQPRGPYREDTWDPTYQPAGPPPGPIDHPPAPGYEYPDQAWSSDQYFAQGVCTLSVSQTVLKQLRAVRSSFLPAAVYT